MKKKLGTIFLILTLVFTNFISYKAGKDSKTLDAGNTSSGDYGMFTTFVDTIKRNYYFEYDEEKMKEEVKKAIFSSLGDPYSQYMTEKDMKDMQRISSGKFIGVGLQVAVNENGEVVVISPIKGGPSERAGILPDDVIVKINDEDIPKNDLESSVKMMRGDEKVGSVVKLSFFCASIVFIITPSGSNLSATVVTAVKRPPGLFLKSIIKDFAPLLIPSSIAFSKSFPVSSPKLLIDT